MPTQGVGLHGSDTQSTTAPQGPGASGGLIVGEPASNLSMQGIETGNSINVLIIPITMTFHAR